jgi:hypothetical protein
MTGKAALAQPAKHLPAHTPAGHADGPCGCGAEGASPTLARGVWTTHQMVHHLRRPRQRPEMMIAVVANVHVTVTKSKKRYPNSLPLAPIALKTFMSLQATALSGYGFPASLAPLTETRKSQALV